MLLKKEIHLIDLQYRATADGKYEAIDIPPIRAKVLVTIEA